MPEFANLWPIPMVHYILVMLSRIYIDGFRCLTNFELRPGSINLLVGDNGTGKTSVFDALRLVRDIALVGQPVAPVAVAKPLWDTRDTTRFELDLTDGTDTFTYSIVLGHEPDVAANRVAVIRSEELKLGTRVLYAYQEGRVFLHEETSGTSFPYKPDRSFLASTDAAASEIRRFKGLLARIVVLKINPWTIEPGTRDTNPGLSENASNFVSWYRHLSDEQPTIRNRIVDQLRRLIPGLEELALRRIGSDTRVLVAVLRAVGGKSYDLIFPMLSDGQRALTVLYAALYGYTAQPAILCFDEPENFVSLPEIQPWLQELKSATAETTQALVISHHPEVIDYLEDGCALFFDRPDGTVSRVRPFRTDEDEPLSMSQLLARGARP